ncbi:MAG: hypothetical protein WCW27_02330 [Patescibacteria group bacterium]|jgi:hypothetical protein
MQNLREMTVITRRQEQEVDPEAATEQVTAQTERQLSSRESLRIVPQPEVPTVRSKPELATAQTERVEPTRSYPVEDSARQSGARKNEIPEETPRRARMEAATIKLPTTPASLFDNIKEMDSIARIKSIESWQQANDYLDQRIEEIKRMNQDPRFIKDVSVDLLANYLKLKGRIAEFIMKKENSASSFQEYLFKNYCNEIKLAKTAPEARVAMNELSDLITAEPQVLSELLRPNDYSDLSSSTEVLQKQYPASMALQSEAYGLLVSLENIQRQAQPEAQAMAA